MKILRFSAQNVKGIKVAEISPEGDVVTISGKNGAGKSSVLDAIQSTLCSGKLPLKSGESKGKVEIDLGEYTVTRSITDKADRITVKTKDGMTASSPKSFLQKFVGPLSIDPLAFVSMKDRDQLDVLFGMLPDLKSGLEGVEKEMADVKATRSEILATGNRLKVELESLPEYPDAPAEPVDIAELAKAHADAVNGNAELQRRRDAREQRVREVADREAEIAKKEESLAAMQKALDTMKKELEADRAEIEPTEQIPDDADVSRIMDEMNAAKEKNEQVAANQERAKAEEALTQARTTYSELGLSMKKIEAKKGKLLKESKMPIAGLSVEGGVVTYNGIPVSQLSTAERVRVGAAIAVAQNPSARIVLADDVSLLDNESLKTLHETCSGFQLWQVVNDESGGVGFYIEEGTVGAANKEKVAEEGKGAE